jgi:hypothetical protein
VRVAFRDSVIFCRKLESLFSAENLKGQTELDFPNFLTTIRLSAFNRKLMPKGNLPNGTLYTGESDHWFAEKHYPCQHQQQFQAQHFRGRIYVHIPAAVGC